jgi:hypothetical protein
MVVKKQFRTLPQVVNAFRRPIPLLAAAIFLLRLAKPLRFTYIQIMNETRGTLAEITLRLRRPSMNNWGWVAV